MDNVSTATPDSFSGAPAADDSSSSSAGPVVGGLAAGASPDTAAPTNAVSSTPATPVVIKPVRRGWLAGIVDEMRDALAGPAPATVGVDQNGDKFVKQNDSTGGKWMRIVDETLHGAAAGYAAGKGRNPGAALQAGVNAGDKIAQQRAQQNKDASEEVKNAQLDKFNTIKLKHDIASQEFQLTRLKIGATQDDVKFAQSQIDREHTLGSADLGVYKDEADLASVKQQHPDFWKDVYANNIVAIPEIAPDGTRKGIHVFLRTPGIGNQMVEPGTQIMDYVPGKTANDPPSLVPRTLSVPATHNDVDQYNAAAQTRYNKWFADRGEQQYKDAQTKEAKARATEANAAARKDDAEAKAIGPSSAAAAGLTGDAYLAKIDPGQAALVRSIHDGNIAPENLARSLSSKQGQSLLRDVAQAYPDIDTSKLSAYVKTVQDFNGGGKSAQQLQNLNTAFQHMDELAGLNSDDPWTLKTYSERLYGTKDYNRYKSKLTNAAPEIANALAKPGASATVDEIKQVKESLMPLSNRGSAIHEQVNSLIDQYKSIRNKWVNAAPSAVYEAKMPDLSKEAKAVIRKFAPQQANEFWGTPVVDKATKKVIGYSKDGGKTMEPVQN